MKLLLVIAIALMGATGAFACASDDYLCQGFEKSDQRRRETALDMQHLDDVRRRNGESIERDMDAMQRSSDQLFTDSLIMNLDRR